MSDLAHSVRDASRRPEVIKAVEAIYAQLDTEIRQRKPVCSMSGRCCRFEEFGHRLYITTAELATFLARYREGSATPPISGWDGIGCPWQVGGQCAVHQIRPFGCRIYFCDPSAKEWQERLYERYHGDLKRLHESLGIPYFYAEWRLAIRCLPELSL